MTVRTRRYSYRKIETFSSLDSENVCQKCRHERRCAKVVTLTAFNSDRYYELPCFQVNKEVAEGETTKAMEA
jgi:hypothetical protein